VPTGGPPSSEKALHPLEEDDGIEVLAETNGKGWEGPSPTRLPQLARQQLWIHASRRLLKGARGTEEDHHGKPAT